MKSSYSILSNKKIISYVKSGDIIIEPFNIQNINTSSYDVTLGPWFYKEKKSEEIINIYNIYSKKNVEKTWGNPQYAKPYSFYKSKGIKLENIDDDELIIFIDPGEMILAHTDEFIGGVDSVTTMMKARSSLKRNFIECCSCAGWGDCGFFNRWCMEITNNSKCYKIPLVVGRRIAQIIFIETDGILNENYNQTGKYQKNNKIEEMIKEWTPDQILPKLYEDCK